MEYFAKTTKFRLLKNHILKDPLLDWYTIKDEYEPNKVYPSRRSWKRFNDCLVASRLLEEEGNDIFHLGLFFAS